MFLYFLFFSKFSPNSQCFTTLFEHARTQIFQIPQPKTKNTRKSVSNIGPSICTQTSNVITQVWFCPLSTSLQTHWIHLDSKGQENALHFCSHTWLMGSYYILRNILPSWPAIHIVWLLSWLSSAPLSTILCITIKSIYNNMIHGVFIAGSVLSWGSSGVLSEMRSQSLTMGHIR